MFSIHNSHINVTSRQKLFQKWINKLKGAFHRAGNKNQFSGTIDAKCMQGLELN